MNESEFAYLKRVIKAELGFDAESYRSTQMRRRLAGFVQRKGGGSVALLCKRLHSDLVLRDDLANLLTINVSEFFRDPAQFQLVQDVVLPELAAHGSAVRIWSAGCAQGEEPYTLATICELAGITSDILATDIDGEALSKARAGGPYSPTHVRKTPVDILNRFFAETPDGYFVKNPVRRRVQFARHDLISDPQPRQFDLISCRNVTIYFTPETKSHVIRRFFSSLRPGGYLFIGGAESLLGPEGEGFSRIAGNFYQRKAQHSRQPALSASN